MRDHILQVAKAVLAAILVSLAFVLIFTLIIQLFNLPAEAVKPVNQVFKILAVAAGGILFIRGEHGLAKGFIHGLLAIVLTYFLFALIAGSLEFSWLFVPELILGGVAGAISGIIGVNMKKRQ